MLSDSGADPGFAVTGAGLGIEAPKAPRGSGQIVRSEQGERFPLPSLSPPLSFLLTPSFSSLPLPFPSLPLEIDPLNPARGSHNLARQTKRCQLL